MHKLSDWWIIPALIVVFVAAYMLNPRGLYPGTQQRLIELEASVAEIKIELEAANVMIRDLAANAKNKEIFDAKPETQKPFPQGWIPKKDAGKGRDEIGESQ